MSIIAMVPLHQLILDADRLHLPYEKYNLKVGFSFHAVREQDHGGGFLTDKDREKLDLFNITESLQDVILRRDRYVQPQHSALVHLALSQEGKSFGFCLTIPQVTKH